MNKNLAIVSALTILMMFAVSCDNHHGQNEATKNEGISIIDDPAQLASRLVFGGSIKKMPARQHVASVNAPSIPADALPLKDQPTNWNNGVTLTRGKAYYINEPWTGTISQDWTSQTGSIDIYINANTTFSNAWWSDDTPVNIYILHGAVPSTYISRSQ